MPSVYVSGKSPDYEEMFTKEGWSIANSKEEANLLQFTGGADVHPSLYRETPHPKLVASPERDIEDTALYVYGRANKKPMAGICRGGQFLHVKSGGSLYQHVNNHHESHMAHSSFMPGSFRVSSTHHQMMRMDNTPDMEGSVVLLYTDLATIKEGSRERAIYTYPKEDLGFDIEAVYHAHTNCLCYQPHPEFSVHDSSLKDCKEAYFFFLGNYLGLSK